MIQPTSPVLPRALPAAGALAVLALFAWLVRADVYLAVAPAVASSAMLSAISSGIASYGLLGLVALAGFLAVRSFLRDRTTFWRLASGGTGVILAYLLSEGIKVLVAQERPCRVWDVTTALACPETGDWSWPSNHSVLAAAFAAACIIALPRTAWFAVPIALLVAISRLAAGVHYLHDVASGLALGVLIVSLVVVILRPLARRLPDTASPRGRMQR